jgi:hypothetical protein
MMSSRIWITGPTKSRLGALGKVLGLRERRCADLEIEQIRSNGQQTILVTVISLMMDCI